MLIQSPTLRPFLVKVSFDDSSIFKEKNSIFFSFLSCTFTLSSIIFTNTDSTTNYPSCVYDQSLTDYSPSLKHLYRSIIILLLITKKRTREVTSLLTQFISRTIVCKCVLPSGHTRGPVITLLQ